MTKPPTPDAADSLRRLANQQGNFEDVLTIAQALPDPVRLRFRDHLIGHVLRRYYPQAVTTAAKNMADDLAGVATGDPARDGWLRLIRTLNRNRRLQWMALYKARNSAMPGIP